VTEDTARLREHLLAQRFWADHGHVDAIVEHPADKIGSHWYAHPETDAPIGQGVDLLARMPLLFGDPGGCRLRELEFDLLGREFARLEYSPTLGQELAQREIGPDAKRYAGISEVLDAVHLEGANIGSQVTPADHVPRAAEGKDAVRIEATTLRLVPA
jgi:hypothetical protein